jgi:predicted NAD/FAD-binding protein
VLEAGPRAGGHIHAVPIEDDDGQTHWIDTGFIVWTRGSYPHAAALFDELGLPSQPFVSPVAVWDRGGDGGARSLAEAAARCGAEAGRDLRRLLGFWARGEGLAVSPDLTIGELLQGQRFHPELVEQLIVPALVVLWGFQAHEALGMAAPAALALLGRTRFVDGEHQLRRLVPSSQPYLEALTARLARPVRTDCRVTELAVEAEGVVVVHGGQTERFDRALVAVQPPQALAMLASPTRPQHNILRRLPTHRSLAVVHEDRSLMPADPALAQGAVMTWLSARHEPVRRSCVTWNATALHGIARQTPVYVTLCSQADFVGGLIAPTAIRATIRHTHIALTPAYRVARRRLLELETSGRIAFAGSWQGATATHECAIQSAHAAADRLTS